MAKVDAVIVTFNRLEKLKHALACYERQTMPFRNVIVVDNHSTDGTGLFLEEWKNAPSRYGKHVLSLDSNLGGSGGFYEGEKFALTLEPDWVFISDDDAYPEDKLVEKFLGFTKGKEDEKISAVCASIWDMDGELIYDCRSHIHISPNCFSIQAATGDEYKESFFKFNCLSYVGVFLNAQALSEAGLVNKDFFIYQDDVEHSVRLSRYGAMYCIPGMKVIHDSLPPAKTAAAVISSSLWKEYYAARNRAWLFLRHYPNLGRKHVFNTLLGMKARKDASLSAVNKMTLEGIKDACWGKLGIHATYRPGLIIDSNLGLPYPKLSWRLAYPFLRIVRMVKQ